jgi:hypothetical protein
MGTNYYLEREVCPQCHQPKEKLHIGKSSMGWCFSLHIYPERGIKSLNNWRYFWRGRNNLIRDEYGGRVPKSIMLREITERSRDDLLPDDKEFYERNHAENGPDNLLRAKVDGTYCVAHGKGTWDCFIGEFC